MVQMVTLGWIVSLIWHASGEGKQRRVETESRDYATQMAGDTRQKTEER